MEKFWTLLDTANKDVRHVVRQKAETFCGAPAVISNDSAMRFPRADLAEQPSICRACLKRMTTDH